MRMTVRDAYRVARRHPLVVAGIVLMVMSALLSAASGRMAYDATRQLNEVIENDEARQCVEAWRDGGQIRAAIPIPTEAIITIAEGATREQVAELRALVDQQILATFPDPDCDLDAALAELND